MKYNLHKPCNDCPFRREGGIPLRRGRIREIARAVTTNPGATFACHKTTVSRETRDGSTERVDGPNSQHCAGALTFALKQDAIEMPQMNRIAIRLGMLDPEQLQDQDAVWDDVDEWLENGTI